MSDENTLALFQPGKTVMMQRTDNLIAQPYVESVMRVIMADANGTGILAQLANHGDETRPVVFVPFDGTTTFAFVSPGFFKYGQIFPETEVLDLESNFTSTMGEFYPPYFDKPQVVPVGTPGISSNAPAGAPAPGAQPEAWMQFQNGTVLIVASTSNPGLSRYVGRVFQVQHADANGVLATPERNSGLTEAVYLPFDGNTEFTLNPAGTYSFTAGLTAGQQVYNPTSSSYVVVEQFCPSIGFAFVPAPFVYVDTYVPVIGGGVYYDPYYYDPFWPYW